MPLQPPNKQEEQIISLYFENLTPELLDTASNSWKDGFKVYFSGFFIFKGETMKLKHFGPADNTTGMPFCTLWLTFVYSKQ